MNDFDKTTTFLHSVGVGYKVISIEGETLFENKKLENESPRFSEFNGEVSIKIGGHTEYKKVDGYTGFYSRIMFNLDGSIFEFGIWE